MPSSVRTNRSSRGSAPVSSRTAASIAAVSIVDLLPGRRLLERLEVRLHARRPRARRARIAASTCSAIVVCAVEREVARKLQVERDLDAAVDVEHGQVVDLPHMRDGERGGEDALAECRRRSPRGSTWTTTSIPGSASCSASLDAVRGRVALADRGSGRDPDDDVREVLPSRPAQSEPAELDGRIEAAIARRAIRASSSGERSMSTSTFRLASRNAAATTSAGDEERRDRVTGGEAERGGDQAGEHRERSREVAPEVERVGEQRVAPVEARAPQRDHRSRRVDHEHEPDRGERPPGRLDVELDDAGEAQDREHARCRALTRMRKPASASAARFWAFAVPVRVAAIRRTNRDGHGEEREQRGREVGARVRRLGEQAEARARQACDELDRDEETGGPDRDERGAPLRRHGGRLRGASAVAA